MPSFSKDLSKKFLYTHMKDKFIGEIIISFSLISLLIFFINPFNLLMPQPLHPFMVPFLVILFIIFAGLLWKETPGDEREQLHKFIASRFAYFAALAALILGVVLQSFKGEIDPWLIISLCVALLAKIFGLIYGYIKR